jgi:hypothetical protein
MRAFEIYVNGEPLCLAGVSDASILTAITHYVGRGKGRLYLSVGGLLVPQEEHVHWKDRDLAVGDEIRIRIIESEKVDAPTKRYAIDPKKGVLAQKRYVRKMAKKFGWKIQSSGRRP